ncbi:hypothetical protein GR160_02855 [Flavobacterium sp. Sd200]|uniref:hypothetical protein n=1 Tax=Flavobacterium sp. Sd200 TaxID=2692211 RepID=UPI001370DAEB|nr:hypothetical protein [Flavobacterium sp. Sd200]MXN90153.1 hypothetical protein [Flavobacterium sp. Sd200]
MAYKSYLNREKLTLGLRNNNPGNLVRTSIDWEGKIPHSLSKDKRFEQFYELRYGIRALMRDIITDITKGNNTIAGLIEEFSPAIENNTANYIRFVSNSLGVLPTAVFELTEESLVAICKVIIRMENNADVTTYITDDDYQDALEILGKPLKKKQIP